MKTPQDFINQYNGKVIDDDGAYGAQCVDGYRVFCKWIGIGAYPTGTGWADGYWYLRYDRPIIQQTFDFIEDKDKLQKGDWCFWASGSSCPLSHVSMFVGYAEDKDYGYFFGENQGEFKGFQTVKIKTDILGAFRWKEWSDMPNRLVDGLQKVVYNNATYHVYKSYNGMNMYMLSAVGGDHALQDITSYDDDNMVIYAIGNCNYFQMNKEDYGQHYGVEFSHGDGIHSQANQYLPFNEKYIAYYQKDKKDGYVFANKFWIDEFDFACSPYSVRIHNGIDVNVISTAFANKEEYVTNQTAYFRLKTGEWCIAVSESKVKPQSIVNAMKAYADIEEMFIVDGGGSSQLWAWDRNTREMTKVLYTGRPLPNVLVLAKKKDDIVEPDIPSEPDEPVVPEPVPPTEEEDGKINTDEGLKDIIDNATKEGYLFEMSNKMYDFLKIVALLIIPVIMTEYAKFAEIWGWNYTPQITDSLAELIKIIGVIIAVSSVGYAKEHKK